MVETNMRPEDRLAEKLKNDTLGAFFSEDDLLPIARKAIEKAFFEPIKLDPYGKTSPPIIVDMANRCLREEVENFVKQKFSELVSDEKFNEVLSKIMINSIGSVFMDGFDSAIKTRMIDFIYSSQDHLANIIKSKL